MEMNKEMTFTFRQQARRLQSCLLLLLFRFVPQICADSAKKQPAQESPFSKASAPSKKRKISRSELQLAMQPAALVAVARSQDNLQDALKWYEAAANRKHVPSMLDTAAGYAQQGNWDKALAYYKKAAMRKNEIALYELGVLFQQGRVVPRNFTKAAYLYSEAVVPRGRHVSAMYNLGRLLDEEAAEEAEEKKRGSRKKRSKDVVVDLDMIREHVEKDEWRESKHWYAQACEKGKEYLEAASNSTSTSSRTTSTTAKRKTATSSVKTALILGEGNYEDLPAADAGVQHVIRSPVLIEEDDAPLRDVLLQGSAESVQLAEEEPEDDFSDWDDDGDVEVVDDSSTGGTSPKSSGDASPGKRSSPDRLLVADFLEGKTDEEYKDFIRQLTKQAQIEAEIENNNVDFGTLTKQQQEVLEKMDLDPSSSTGAFVLSPRHPGWEKVRRDAIDAGAKACYALGRQHLEVLDKASQEHSKKDEKAKKGSSSAPSSSSSSADGPPNLRNNRNEPAGATSAVEQDHLNHMQENMLTPDEILHFFLDAYRLNPEKQAKAAYNAALLYFATERRKDAYAYAKKAAKQGLAEAMTMLGTLYGQDGKSKRAEKWRKKAREAERAREAEKKTRELDEQEAKARRNTHRKK
ncbi:unnamed protein product [Amoebophrya sp. A25]|nr:unnamed protein product [Amoebophrya sp. A25]|eukprot:GSA25T00014750001.1